MAAYGQTQYSPALQPAVPYTAYTHHTQGYSMPSYSEYNLSIMFEKCVITVKGYHCDASCKGNKRLNDRSIQYLLEMSTIVSSVLRIFSPKMLLLF